MNKCICGSGEYKFAEFDGHGVFLFYACSKCWQKQRSKYRADIFENYQCDEPLDEE